MIPFQLRGFLPGTEIKGLDRALLLGIDLHTTILFFYSSILVFNGCCVGYRHPTQKIKGQAIIQEKTYVPRYTSTEGKRGVLTVILFSQSCASFTIYLYWRIGLQLHHTHTYIWRPLSDHNLIWDRNSIAYSIQIRKPVPTRNPNLNKLWYLHKVH